MYCAIIESITQEMRAAGTWFGYILTALFGLVGLFLLFVSARAVVRLFAAVSMLFHVITLQWRC